MAMFDPAAANASSDRLFGAAAAEAAKTGPAPTMQDFYTAIGHFMQQQQANQPRRNAPPYASSASVGGGAGPGGAALAQSLAQPMVRPVAPSPLAAYLSPGRA